MYENMYNQHTFKDLIEAPAMNLLRLSPCPPGRGREGNIISRAGNNALEKEHIVIHFDICRGRAGRSARGEVYRLITAMGPGGTVRHARQYVDLLFVK